MYPTTPKELLKARYEAFKHGNIDFILETHHPENRDQVNRESVQNWSLKSKWLHLNIEEEKQEGERAFILFTVRYERNYETVNHREWAEFRKDNNQWFYFDSTFPSTSVRSGASKVGRNDPCHCGSGKKFKKCHLLKRLETPADASKV